ncbi:EamA family transporter [Taklimakanibacter lacteus]|uniref:EamA family transporter n=1 Tax=Taklimakanibacter lacteus TaxID=2268456 RepID=UPI000E670299
MKAATPPPHAYFLVSALFHYLGPSFAVLLFAQMSPLGVAWLRIASAALIFSLWIRPWRTLAEAEPGARRLILLMGLILAAMNGCFYLAIDQLPLATVAAIEFAATIAVALLGLRSARNLLALGLAVTGVLLLIGFQYSSDLIGLGLAFANALLFALYVIVGHRLARQGGASGIERLGAAMAIAFIAALPFGLGEATRLLAHPLLILAGIGVGISSSVIPYICDQLAMARLPRASFALMLTLLPAIAAVTGALVLRQIPGPLDMAGIILVILGVGLHRPAEVEA